MLQNGVWFVRCEICKWKKKVFECWLRLLKYKQHTHTHTQQPHTHTDRVSQSAEAAAAAATKDANLIRARGNELIKFTWGGQTKAAPYTHSLCNEWPLIEYPWHSYTHTHTHSLTPVWKNKGLLQNDFERKHLSKRFPIEIPASQLVYYHKNMATDQQTTTTTIL